jgi:predicted negative regulator of RcsB-dependent stress response
MQAQDTTTLYLLKLWPWIEANKNRLIGGAVIIAAAIFIYSFFSYQHEQKEIAAGQALTQLSITAGGATAEACLKIANEFPGTIAGQRAMLQGGAALYEAGKFPDAQAQFQKFLDAHPGSELTGQAALGVAASMDAMGKPDAAKYQAVVNNSTDPALVSAAKFALGRISEAQGKLTEALAYYEDAARANAGSSLGYEAGLRIIELRKKVPGTTPAPAPASAPATIAPVKTGN